MPISDELLEYLAVQYHKACIDSTRFPFIAWASLELEKMGYTL